MKKNLYALLDKYRNVLVTLEYRIYFIMIFFPHERILFKQSDGVSVCDHVYIN